MQAERPSDMAIAQAFIAQLKDPGTNHACYPDSAPVFAEKVIRKARTLDAAPSEPSAEHWRTALYEAGEFQEWITTQQAEWIEQRAREIAKEGK